MSGNKKRPRAEPNVVVNAESLKVDEDLLCLICTELVENAKQAICCGALFCGTCIDQWINRDMYGDHQGCPNCRAMLLQASIVPDPRSDRKSAAQPRRCPFHENHHCDFVGTRQEVAGHKAECPCDPDLCTSQRCKAEKETWILEKDQMQERIDELKNIIEETEKRESTAAREAKFSLVSAAFLSPERVLRRALGFEGARILHVDNTKRYAICAKYGNQLPQREIKIHITEANYNVSIFCYHNPTCTGPEAIPQALPKLRISCTLVSRDPAVDNLTSQINLDSGTRGYGRRNWLTDTAFSSYVKDGTFAVGWNVTILP